MKRAFALTLVFTSLLATAGFASEESSETTEFRFDKLGKAGSIADVVAKFKERHKAKKKNDKPQNENPIPIDPGNGTGKPLPQPTVPPARPGFVWVGDHWEREKAPSKPQNPTIITDPIPGTVIIRDHRKPVYDSSQAPGGTGVTSGPIIRDHRTPAVDTSSAPGGTLVTSKPRPKKSGGGGLLGSLGSAASGVGKTLGNAASGVGKTVGNAASGAGKTVGKAVISAGNAVGVGYGTVTPAGGKPTATIRDHRN